MKLCSIICITTIVLYRSRQYYESKVLHNTEVTIYSTAHHFLKNNYFETKLLKDFVSPFKTLLLRHLVSKQNGLNIDFSKNLKDQF